MQVNIHEAKTNLSKLIEAVQRGEEVIIAKAGKPLVKLIKHEPPPERRKPGILKGKLWISPDFDEPDEEIIRRFYGEDQ